MGYPSLIILQPTPYCNIRCSYCYLSARDDRRRMERDVVEAIADNLLSHLPRDSEPSIVWHAGEPTTVPIAWYRDAYDRLAPAAPAGARWAMQTNGVQIDERWAEFFVSTRTSLSVSIDGPKRFHDARRLTRSGGPTWDLAMRGLRILQDAGLDPSVIAVLSPEALSHAGEFFEFFRDNDINYVNFNIDEAEAANAETSFSDLDRSRMRSFIEEVLRLAFEGRHSLFVKEVERIGSILAGGRECFNEQVNAWSVVVVGVDGALSTYSPELMEFCDPNYDKFVFGNILKGGLEQSRGSAAFERVSREIAEGVRKCAESCPYFDVCGGGAPANKLSETKSFQSTTTLFCRLSIQSYADALASFLSRQRGMQA